VILVLTFGAWLALVAFGAGSPRALGWRTWLARVVALAWAYVRSSPATFVYLFVVWTTTRVIAAVPASVAHSLLTARSTNLHNLAHDPIRVLVQSAFWTGGQRLTVWLPIFVFILAPAERWLGTARGVTAFAIGHVGATLIVALGLAAAIEVGQAPQDLARVTDVGVSYGFYCIAALLAYRLTRPWGLAWATSLLVWVAYPIVTNPTFTTWGHLVSVAIGFTLVALTRAPQVRRRATQRLLVPASAQPE